MAEAYFDGVIGRFEEALGIPKTLLAWINGAARPRLGSLIEVCFRIGLPPVELLSRGFEPRMHGGEFHRGERRPTRAPLAMTHLRRIESRRFVDELIQAGRHVTIKDAVAELGMSVSAFKYHLPDAFEKLAAHAAKMRARRTKARFDGYCEEAVKIARRLFAESTHVPRRRLDRALGEAGLTIRNPLVRKAAFAELRRLREDAAGVGELRKAEGTWR